MTFFFLILNFFQILFGVQNLLTLFFIPSNDFVVNSLKKIEQININLDYLLLQQSMQDKHLQFQQYKRQKFQKISQDKSMMFNFFLENNDVFKFITPVDEIYLRKLHMKYLNTCTNAYFGALLGVFVVDKIILKKFFPQFRINGFRGSIFFTKWIGLPFLAYGIAKEYLNNDVQQGFLNMQQKYSFGFEDYIRATQIWQRAQKVGRLQQLFEKRGRFDWTGIPTLEEMNKTLQKNPGVNKQKY